jgi:hypothetical protein
MSDDKVLREGEELQNMARTAGWALMEQYLQDQIKARAKELENKEFTDLSQVARLQGEIQGLKRPLTFLQDRQRRSMALQKEEK